jgi:hypothetical protein
LSIKLTILNDRLAKRLLRNRAGKYSLPPDSKSELVRMAEFTASDRRRRYGSSETIQYPIKTAWRLYRDCMIVDHRYSDALGRFHFDRAIS